MPLQKPLDLFKEFFQSEIAGGLLLIFCTLLSIILANSSFALYQDLSPPTTTFTHYTVSLSQTGWHVGSSSGPNASAAQMLQILGSLNALYIDADWQTGFETTALDNVLMIPEPGCMWILTFGALISSKRRRSSRHQ